MDSHSSASYRDLYRTGELKSRVHLLNKKLESCSVCPRRCGVNRLEDKEGYCKTGRRPLVCSYCAHFGEESPISGDRGSGTIFFGQCNLRCVFCQNADISQIPAGRERYAISVNQLARIMLQLQDVRQCHNINFVSPGHFVPQIAAAVYQAVPAGLHIPLVYNSNGYDDMETLQLLDGIIDVYMPDLKYADPVIAAKYSAVRDYPHYAHTALKEMFRQVGLLQMDDQGVAMRGLLIRHLVLPDNIAGTTKVLEWVKNELSIEVTISLMAQYHPCHYANKIPKLNRVITQKEYSTALRFAYEQDFKNILYQ